MKNIYPVNNNNAFTEILMDCFFKQENMYILFFSFFKSLVRAKKRLFAPVFKERNLNSSKYAINIQINNISQCARQIFFIV